MVELSRAQLHELYYYMRLTRSLEERLELLFRQGRIVGGLYRSLGQEAESVGAAYALANGDWLSPSIRNLGAMLVRGVRPVDIFLQYMGRSAAPTRGKDTTNHFEDSRNRILGPISPLGDALCVVAGLAWSLKVRHEPQVALTFLGDGASRTGAAHEGLSLAAVQRVPLVVIVEHNGWAFATPTAEQTALENLVEMAAGYGVHGVAVDGNDVLAVYEAAAAGVERARGGGGMSLIEVKTYRMKGHAQHDTQKYVPSDELEIWRARDPIDRYAERLTAEGTARDDQLAALDERVQAQLDRAVERALASPHPEPEETLAGVYAEGRQPEPWARTL